MRYVQIMRIKPSSFLSYCRRASPYLIFWLLGIEMSSKAFSNLLTESALMNYILNYYTVNLLIFGSCFCVDLVIGHNYLKIGKIGSLSGFVWY